MVALTDQGCSDFRRYCRRPLRMNSADLVCGLDITNAYQKGKKNSQTQICLHAPVEIPPKGHLSEAQI